MTSGPEDLQRRGLAGLVQLRTDYGFSASDAESGRYPALYGRDSLWTVLLLLAAVDLTGDEAAAALAIAAGRDILRSLAGLQGTVTDDRIEEQPGKIPHEHHPVPSAHAVAMELPLVGGRSYAGFDETFLFVLAYRAFARFQPDDPVVGDLAPNVQRALEWIDACADEDGDGLYEYQRRNPANLLNQAWKDSFDAATHTGFDVPPHPIAWIEVRPTRALCAAGRSASTIDSGSGTMSAWPWRSTASSDLSAWCRRTPGTPCGPAPSPTNGSTRS